MKNLNNADKTSDKAEKELRISDVSDNEVKFCEDCQKWVKPPKCNHCGNEDLIPDWTY
jgi:hypothetical protein